MIRSPLATVLFLSAAMGGCVVTPHEGIGDPPRHPGPPPRPEPLGPSTTATSEAPAEPGAPSQAAPAEAEAPPEPPDEAAPEPSFEQSPIVAP